MNYSTTGGPYGPVEYLPNGRNYSLELTVVFSDYWFIFVGAAVLYLPLVYLGQRFMEKREPVSGLKWILFTWNAFLSTLSAVMFYRCFAEGYVQSLFRDLTPLEAICRHRHFGLDYGTSWTFNWMGYTKVMNTFVHVFMYAYFAAASIRIFFPYPHVLTALQILQMVVGSTTVYYSWYCPEHVVMWWAGMIMYCSYFVLFSKFFYDKYSTPVAPRKPAATVKRSKKE